MRLLFRRTGAKDPILNDNVSRAVIQVFCCVNGSLVLWLLWLPRGCIGMIFRCCDDSNDVVSSHKVVQIFYMNYCVSYG